jgi:hypothetical protein
MDDILGIVAEFLFIRTARLVLGVSVSKRPTWSSLARRDRALRRCELVERYQSVTHFTI